MVSVTKSDVKNTSSQSVHYIQCILKSGVILDEDMDSILMHFHDIEQNSSKIKLTFFQKLSAGISLTGILFLVQRNTPLYYLPLAASPLVMVGIQRLLDKMYRKSQKRNIELFVDSVNKIAKLNRMICEYFKLRVGSSSSGVNILNPYSRSMKRLIQVVFQEEINLLYSFRIYVRQFATYIPFFKTDYEYLDNIELHFLSAMNINNISDGVIYLQKLCDVYLLMASNTLTCLAIMFCPNMWAEYNIKVDELLDKVVPKLKNMSTKCYNIINKQFDDTKYFYLNRSQIKKQFKPAKPNASSKLLANTATMIAHTSDILEKSQIIFRKLQDNSLHTLEEKEELGRCIADLRSHVFDYYESLDVLHKLYEVHINKMKPPSIFKAETCPEEALVSTVFANGKAKSDVNSEKCSSDEEYEAYVGANDNSSESNSFSIYEEQESRKYASALCQELKHKLRNHTQFVAARKKRGIIDEEPDVKPAALSKAQLENLIPPLPLPIGIPKPPLPNCDNFQRQLVPPPPPPPLPPVFLPGDNPEQLYTVDDFLESIKAASKNHNSTEEVFGSDED